MEPALSGPGRQSPALVPSPEVAIRTLGVGLVAIAAVVASLTVVRQRNEERQPELPPILGRAPAVDLDAIRSAGL